MKVRTWIVFGCAWLASTAAAAPPQWGGSVTLSSNYLLRGVSRSQNDPALSAEVHAQFASGLFTSLWASTSRARVTDSTTPELAGSLGWSAQLNDDWSTRFTYTHYEGPWMARAGFYRYDEFVGELSWLDRLQVSVTYSPNTSRFAPAFGAVWHRHASVMEAVWQQPLGRRVSGYVGAGYFDLSDLFDSGYWYGSVGARVGGPRWQLDLSYVMVDADGHRLSYPGAADNRFLASLTLPF
jgi:uncharacterized protein (TIGR02001 family)